MVNPAKVLAFLDIFGAWDPTLALVMGAAVAVSALGYCRREAPRPPRSLRRGWKSLPGVTSSRRLLTGAAIFGVGWGLAGLCPGPALTLLPLGCAAGSSLRRRHAGGDGAFPVRAGGLAAIDLQARNACGGMNDAGCDRRAF